MDNWYPLKRMFAAFFTYGLVVLALTTLSWQVSGAILPPAPKPQPARLILMTEVSPPGEILDQQGQLSGPTVALLKLLQQRLHENIDIQLWPWARAYQTALNTPNVGIFETLRNSDREALFQWVGPLKHYTMALYGKAQRIEDNLSQQQLAQRYIACTNRGSAYIDQIEKLGFRDNVNLVITSKTGQCTELLAKDRVDLAVFNQVSAHQFDGDADLQPVIPLGDIQLYLAFSTHIDPARVQRWQQALEKSYLDGSMASLYRGIYPAKMIHWLQDFARARQAALPDKQH